MKILMVHTNYAERGGEWSVVQSELALLKSNGYNVKELYFDNQKFTALNVLLLPFNIYSFFKVLAACRGFKPDIVHLHNIHFAASPSVIWAIRLMKIPIVQTLHNYRLLCPSGTLFFGGKLYFKSLNRSFPWPAIKDKVYRNSSFLTFWLGFSTWFNNKIGTWKMISKYIVFTEQGRQLLLNSSLSLGNETIVIKPNFTGKNPGVSIARNDSFLFIGRLSTEKGISLLLKAFAHNGLPLTIIGDGPLSHEISKSRETNPLIDWRGFQNADVINAELKRCTAVIQPSVCYEGMPVTIIEAFASSTPVVASNHGAMERMVEHNYNGLLFEAGSVDDLNFQLTSWINLNAAIKETFYANAKKTYQQTYTPEKNIKHLLSVYKSAITTNA